MLALLVKAKWLLPLLLSAFLLVGVMGSAAAAGPEAAAPVGVAEASTVETVMGPYNYTMPMSLTIALDTEQLFTGAQLIIDALSSPYLLIAGLGLGVAILGAILKAVTTLRL